VLQDFNKRNEKAEIVGGVIGEGAATPSTPARSSGGAL